MSESKPSWANPLPSSTKKKPTPTGGYTKPDRAVRCRKCFVGADEGGGAIGTPIAIYTVSAAMPEGGSIAVARVPMCYKCREILPFEVLESGRNLGVTGINIIRCLKARQGLLAMPWFTLEELLTGRLEQATELPESVAQPRTIERAEIVDPENMEREVQAALPL